MVIISPPCVIHMMRIIVTVDSNPITRPIGSHSLEELIHSADDRVAIGRAVQAFVNYANQSHIDAENYIMCTSNSNMC